MSVVRPASAKRPNQPNERSVVWVYWKAAAEADELRWSVESVKRNLSGWENLVVCGDHPGDWFEGVHIPAPRVNPKFMRETYGVRWRRRWIKWGDSVHKMRSIIACPEVKQRFLWLYDDSFIVAKVRFEEFAQPYYWSERKEWLVTEKKTWRECKRRTIHHLANEGFTTYDFSSHFPCVFNKDLMANTLEKFDCLRRPRLIETLYMNHHHGTVARKMPYGLFRYSSKKRSPNLKPFKLFNSGNGRFTRNRDRIIRAIKRAK